MAAGVSTLHAVSATIGSQKASTGTLSASFSYCAPTAATSTVANAPTAGGGIITIHGGSFGSSDFTQSIRVGGTACKASQWLSEGSVTCNTPGGSGYERDAVITVGGLRSTLSGLFTYNFPSVNSIFPGNAPTTGGTTLTMLGGEFGNAGTGQEIRVGGTVCITTLYTSDSSLHCKIPAGVGSNPHLQVISSGLSGFGRNLLSYDNPTVSGVTPANSATSGGSTISVFGSGFGTFDYALSNHTVGAAVNGNAGSMSGYHSDSSIVVVSPTGVGKSLTTSVTVTGNCHSAEDCQRPTSGIMTQAFSYDLPVVTDILPRNSPTKGGATVTVYGFNLGDGSYAGQSARVLSGHSSVLNYEASVSGTPSNTEMLVVIGVGAGVNKTLQVTVASQSGNSFAPVLIRFDPPNITLVYPDFGGTMGGDTLTVVGNNFGPGFPPNGGPVAVAYHDQTGFPGDCESISAGTDPHTVLFCVTKRGAGRGFNLTVTVDSQVATALAAFSYAAPVVVSLDPNFSPTAGGGTITMIGSNFGILDYETTAQVGDTLCSSVQWFADSQVECSAPPGAGGGHKVAVGSDGQYGSRANMFSYSAPALASVNVGGLWNQNVFGPTSGGILATVTGVNFGTQDFYSRSAEVGGRNVSQATFISDTSILIGIPPGGGTQVISITVAGQPSDLVLGFNYQPPNVTAITPLNGVVLGGNLLRVYGSNFGFVDTFPYASIGDSSIAAGTSCTSNIWTSDTAMTAVTPAGRSLPHDVFVHIPGFAVSKGSLVGAWSYDVPFLTSITPGNAPTQGTTVITIRGKNFIDPPVINIGSTSATTITLISDVELRLNAPPGIGKDHGVSGTFDGEQSLGVIQFSYDAPVITHIDPVNGPTIGGYFVTIFGQNFGRSAEIGQVNASIGATQCPSVQGLVDHYAIQIKSSGGYGIALPVIVNVASQASNNDTIFSYDVPVVTALNPNVGNTASATTVTILGRNFGEASASRSAHVGNTLCSTLDFISFSALECTVEPGVGASLTALVQVDIISGSKSELFSYYAPVVDSLNRANGPTSGGTTSTVVGSHFGNYDSTVTGKIESSSCSSILWTSDSTILCVVPDNIGKGRQFSMAVEGQRTTRLNTFSYDKPVLTAITPAHSPTSGSTSSPIVLHGFNFGKFDSAGALQVQVGTTTSPPVTWLSDNQVRATIPDGEGTAHSTYISVAAQSSELPAAFSYDPPTVTALIYATSDTDGGNKVTVLGTNFGSTAATQTGTVGSTSASIDYVSHAVLMITTPPGTGKDLPVTITITGQATSFSNCGKPSCAFSYSAPRITHVTPKYGASAGSSSITLYGTNFGQGVASETAASVHSQACASILYVSSSSIVCTTPANALVSSGASACTQCNAYAVAVQITINGLDGSLLRAFSYTNNGTSAANAALWCRAAKVAFAANTDGLIYIDPDGDGDTTNAYQAWCRQQADGYIASLCK